MIWSISWKNVWRSKKRSLIVITAVTLGTIAGVFSAGLMKGWVNQRVENVIHTEDSHIKIHNPEYLLNEEIIYKIPEIKTLEQYLNNTPSIKAYSKRIKLMAMASTSRGNTALMLHGIDIKKEKEVSNVYTKIVENGGDFFESNNRNPIVISDKTAEQLRIKYYIINDEAIDSLAQLEVDTAIIEQLRSIKGERFKTEKIFKKELKTILTAKQQKDVGLSILEVAKHYRLRSKIVFTFNDANGNLIYQTFKVCGIFKSGNTMFDQMTAYVPQSNLRSIASFGDNDFHEIAIILQDDANIKTVQSELKNKFKSLSVMTWMEVSPETAMMSGFMDILYFVIMIIILAALAFGIINTMLMAILERTKELGMLMAVGMNKKRVFQMIMLETVFLTLVGAVIGMILGAILIFITGKTGLNFASAQEGLEAIGMSSSVYPSIDAKFFFIVTGLVIITGILSSITPARRALKLNPIEAIRTD
ncbi:MAG: FtsX-like permease family protein [Prolixibacteraceae bacterium]|jgi:ABC-type lipoprotein release transport system permease subunit|nr:FtsX-like permease family protein [Prolixibacteraceae bacterium]